MDIGHNNPQHILVLGAGLAGLTAADHLSKAGYYLKVLEAEAHVGGLARTLKHHDFRFDVGGHRFVTNNTQLEKHVRHMLGDDCLQVTRSSKIFLRNRYFDYPLKPFNALMGFGPWTSTRILFDYAREQLKSRYGRQATPVSLQDWVIQNFGRRMFDIYFKDYSEKVWGIDCTRIDMRWVEQRIQGLSLGKAIKTALKLNKTEALPTLSRGFLYPRWGIGQIAETMANEIRQVNPILTQCRVTRIHHKSRHIHSVDIQQNAFKTTLNAEEFISTIPLQALIKTLRPLPPGRVLAAANHLRSRDLVTVTLMLNLDKVTDHTWIYTPEKSIPFGRIHEPTNWSRAMAPAGKTLLVIEYFCFRGDAIWSNSDAALVELTIKHLHKLGFIQPQDVIDSVVTRIPNAYPLFEVGYDEYCQIIYDYLAGFDNLFTVGRGGLFRYYNMDHTMLAGASAARHITQSSLIKTVNTGLVA
ncbi:MAG: FAD-dependent oxidoreductase [Gammaproteobacteria bacterium]|nr:FAD-dependent oxidoreductase [Gammaproteobacteria bacterium]